MTKILTGKAHKYGDNINTDIISPPQYMELSVAEAAKYSMSAVDPNFANSVHKGDFFVAGANLGSGSSRELAPLTLKYLGVNAVIAKFFARIFYRNAINIGLVALECPESDKICTDDVLEIQVEKGVIVNKTRGETYQCTPLPPHILDLVEKGGLVPYLKDELGL